MSFTLTADGTDLSTLGLILTDPSSLWDSLDRMREVVRRANNVSSLVVTTEDQIDVRKLGIKAAVEGSSLSQLDTRLDEIRYRLAEGAMQIKMSDRARVLNVERAGPIRVGPYHGAIEQGIREIIIPLVASDPRWYDETDQTPSLSTTAAACPLGTAPVEPVITGLGGTVTIEYQDPSSSVLASLGFTSVASTPVTVDLKAQTIVDNAGAGQMSKLDAGSEFFSLDPHDGDYPTSSWPKLRLTAGTGTATYPRAWE